MALITPNISERVEELKKQILDIENKIDNLKRYYVNLINFYDFNLKAIVFDENIVLSEIKKIKNSIIIISNNITNHIILLLKNINRNENKTLNIIKINKIKYIKKKFIDLYNLYDDIIEKKNDDLLKIINTKNEINIFLKKPCRDVYEEEMVLKEKNLSEINDKVIEINNLFKLLYSEILSQGETVINIENNCCETVHDIESGTDKLNCAEKKKKKKTKCKIILGVLFFFLIFIPIFIMLLVF